MVAAPKVKDDLFPDAGMYNDMFKDMSCGMAYCKIVYKDNEPVDFVYLAVNDAFEQLTKLHNVIGKSGSELSLGLRETDRNLIQTFGWVASTGQTQRLERYFAIRRIWLSLFVYSNSRDCFVVLFNDITERKLFEKRFSQKTQTDTLTELPNFHFFFGLVEKELLRSKRNKLICSLIMIDPDGFKVFNEKYGHEVSDKALQKLTHVSLALLREPDVMARTGESVFGILLPETDAQQAQIVAERLRLAIANMQIPIEGGGSAKLTASLGIASLVDYELSADDFFTNADQAVFLAKRNGGNRACQIRALG